MRQDMEVDSDYPYLRVEAGVRTKGRGNQLSEKSEGKLEMQVSWHI